ncbi:MAG TPA: Smr/MutS family protein [Arenimonas sp.]|nr:Smr/MutS family protein [Arenimonas sp.]
MSRKPAPVDEDDAALFRDAIGEVRPLPAPEAPPPRPKPSPRARRRELDEQEALRLSRRPSEYDLRLAGEESLAYRRPEVAEKILKALRRGHYSVQDEIDLHSLRASDAESLLRRFLGDARLAGRLCVRIIHGKGLRSAGEGSVLKGLVDLMLRQRADVLAFASAPEAMGGTGATLALLAPARPGERGSAAD